MATDNRRSKSSSFLMQGGILAVAGLLVRLIGMLYRLPLAAKIGDEGMGYYSSAYSVYSMLLIISSYSLPLAVSRLVAERLGKKQAKNVGRILRASLFYATVAGAAGFCVLWFGAQDLAQLLEKPFAQYALRSLAPTLWVMAYLGVLRGYFQGYGIMAPTAVSQILEQIVNAAVSIWAAFSLYDAGIRANLVHGETQYAFAYGAAGGTIGTGAGALTAFLFFLLLFFGNLPGIARSEKRDRRRRPESYGEVSVALCVTILPILFSSAVYNIGAVVDDYLFSAHMQDVGAGADIASMWGVYMGKYHLLFNIPVAISNALSSSLIPSLSASVARDDRPSARQKAGMAIRFSMLVAIPSAVGLAVLAGPISDLLFRGGDNTVLIRMTALGSLAVVVFSLSTVSNAILQGAGHMSLPIRNCLVSLGLHVVILQMFLVVFGLGIFGVLYANILFALCVCVMNQWSIRRHLRLRLDAGKAFFLPALAAALMGIAAFGVYRAMTVFLPSVVGLVAAVCVAVPCYFVLLLVFGGMERSELETVFGRFMKGGRKQDA
ncbi:MAG: polysaccharide biosynthesis protein [Lachnospiraceae bacterium]|jgi:stage V sporulation protein B|nr:polysaccharide biosynthesis protein [Lachnospiraceae bacterium]